jgi:hypothetical protein
VAHMKFEVVAGEILMNNKRIPKAQIVNIAQAIVRFWESLDAEATSLASKLKQLPQPTLNEYVAEFKADKRAMIGGEETYVLAKRIADGETNVAVR